MHRGLDERAGAALSTKPKYRSAPEQHFRVGAGASAAAIEFFEPLLAKWDPPQYLPEHARVSNELGCSLREQGRLDEALVHAENAVELFELVVAYGDGTELHQLAGARRNLAKVYAALGRHGDALEQTRESLRLFEVLAGALPHQFALTHVQVMHELSLALADDGQVEESMAQAQRASQRLIEVTWDAD